MKITTEKSFTLSLNKNGTFKTTDTLLTKQKKGNWSLVKNTITLTSVQDSTELNEKFSLAYKSDNKIVLVKSRENGLHITIKSVFTGTGITWVSIIKGAIGLVFLFFIGFLFSKNRRKINWSIVLRGTLLQVILAILILKVPFVSVAFDWLSKGFTKLINFSHDGANFSVPKFRNRADTSNANEFYDLDPSLNYFFRCHFQSPLLFWHPSVDREKSLRG